MDGGVAAFGGADRPRTAFVAGSGGDGVVGAFAVGDADGVDGRHVDDVEAHGGDFRQAEGDVFEGAVLAGNCGGGAGKELVPTGEAGAFAIDPEWELDGVFGGEGEVGVLGDECDEGVGDGGFIVGEVGVGLEAELVGGEG